MMPLLSNAVREAPWGLAGDTPAARRLARLARQALIAEAELTPKPGLVDRRGRGAHTDLSLEIMRRSAVAIEPYFVQMALASQGAQPGQSIRERLALIGRQAERGQLVSAVAMHDNETGDGDVTASTVAATAKAVASFEDRAIPRLVSHGDMVARRYGVVGARGEALSGFPHVVAVGLPALRRKRRSGASEQVARLDTLLSIMASLDDTCLLYRGGVVALAAAKTGAAAVAVVGGTGTRLGREELCRLDRRLMDLQVSPGGSADLLAATLLLDAVEHGQYDVQEVSDGTY